MRDRIFLSFAKACHKDRFLFLIVLIVAMILISPFIEGFIGLKLSMDLFFSIILMTTIYAATQKKIHIIIAVILVIPTLFAVWYKTIAISDIYITIGFICGLILFAFAVILILKYIFSHQVVTRQTISAAVAVYLLIAMMWSFVYRVMAILYPGSFAVAHSELLDAGNIFVYFSFVTITTLGYGDITPIGSQVISIAILEAIIGQIYLVVVVAWFVGMYVSRKSKQ
jgi:voltage-gated potassium channel